MPGFVRKSFPVSVAVDAIEDGVLHRRARVWAPRYVGGALALRGVLQPLLEARATRSKHTADALAQADPAAGHLAGADPLLGLAVPAREQAPAG